VAQLALSMRPTAESMPTQWKWHENAGTLTVKADQSMTLKTSDTAPPRCPGCGS
jgi:hypothetical protein